MSGSKLLSGRVFLPEVLLYQHKHSNLKCKLQKNRLISFHKHMFNNLMVSTEIFMKLVTENK